MEKEYFNLYCKYKSKYLSLKQDINGGSLQLLLNDIEDLTSQDNIQNIYQLDISGIKYILIGEEHNTLERDTYNSFSKIYEKLLKSVYDISNIEVFIESSINNQFIVGTKNTEEINRKIDIKVLDSLRQLTLFKSTNNNFKTTFVDIRDNSVINLKEMIYLENGKLNKNIDIEYIFKIIDNLFILTIDTYLRYMFSLVKKNNFKNISQFKIYEVYSDNIIDNIYKDHEEFNKIYNNFKTELLDLSELRKDYWINILEQHLPFEKFSESLSSVINPFILYKMFISNSKIKILYVGANHSKNLFNILKQMTNSTEIYQYNN